MEEMSFPELPHLPALARWRASTYAPALSRSLQLLNLDNALYRYQISYRRYGIISESFYLQRDMYGLEPDPRGKQELRSRGERAELALSCAVHDFEAVEIAFNQWIARGVDSAGVREQAQLLATMLREGRSRLSWQRLETPACDVPVLP
jgi:hypothetical protein